MSCLHFSRDSSRLALFSRKGWGSTPGVRLWDLTRAAPLGAFVPMSDAPLLLPGNDGGGFLTLELDHGRLRRWNFSSPVPVEDLGTLADWPGEPSHSDGRTFDVARRRLAIGAAHGAIFQWDVNTRQRLAPDADFLQPVRELAYSPDGRWLAASGEDGVVALFDPRSGRRAGPLLNHGGPLWRIAFTPDSRHLLTVTADGHCHRWELGAPQPLSADQWQLWLEAATGLRLDHDNLLPLSAGEHGERVLAAQALPTPLAAAPVEPAHWHGEAAERAELAGQFNAARWHLDRCVGLMPDAWGPLARRSRVWRLEGTPQRAEADLARAAELCHDDGLRHWQQHEAIIKLIAAKK